MKVGSVVFIKGWWVRWFSPQNEVALSGCELNCCTMADHTQDYNLVVGKGEVGHATLMEVGGAL